MPAKYDPQSRTIIVQTDFGAEPELACTALVNGVLCDLLHHSNPLLTQLPEVVDLAVIATGLGTLRSNQSLVSKTGPFWDPTQWETMPRPFLDSHGVAYANAVAAWIRGEEDPEWGGDLNAEIKKPMLKTLKYLKKTRDCFVNGSSADCSTLDQSQEQWWRDFESDLASTKVIALRHLDLAKPTEQQVSQVVNQLRSNDPAVVLNLVATIERANQCDDRIASELRDLTTSPNEVVRSKAMLALTKLDRLDDTSIEMAVDMLESPAKHNVLAGAAALASQDSVAEGHMPIVDRAFMRSLKSLDYEFINLFARAYKRWMDDPKSYIKKSLQEHDVELIQIANEAFDGSTQQVVTLS